MDSSPASLDSNCTIAQIISKVDKWQSINQSRLTMAELWIESVIDRFAKVTKYPSPTKVIRSKYSSFKSMSQVVKRWRLHRLQVHVPVPQVCCLKKEKYQRTEGRPGWTARLSLVDAVRATKDHEFGATLSVMKPNLQISRMVEGKARQYPFSCFYHPCNLCSLYFQHPFPCNCWLVLMPTSGK